MKKFTKRGLIALIAIFMIIGGILFFLLKPKNIVEFNDLSRTIEVNSVVDYHKYIEKVNGDESQLKIDDSQVNLSKLGKYDVTFSLGDKRQTSTFEVVDTVKPEVKLKSPTIIYDYPLKAEELIDTVSDNTKTTASFKKHYSFTKVGEQKVTIKVKDEGGNITEVSTIVTVLEKDNEKPVIKSDEINIIQDSKRELKELIEVSDNQDKNVNVITDEIDLDRSKVGDYTIKVTATDASNNQSKKDITVHVQDRSKEKIVYLTFDDGPSSNTKKILDVLDKYNVKATFFVTGNGQKYNYLIKEAYNKGHTIGLHTYTHSYKTIYVSTESYFDDLTKVGNMVKEQIGFAPKYIRFPGGSSNTISKKYCNKIMSTLTKQVKEKGYEYYDWNVDTTDAAGKNRPVETLVKNGTKSNSQHIMLLAHDTEAKDTTVEAISKIIEYYKQKGYEFKAIDDDTPEFHQRVNN